MIQFKSILTLSSPIPIWTLCFFVWASALEVEPCLAHTEQDLIEATKKTPVAVTVFEDRARVTRSASLTVEEGTHRVVFRQLPGELNPSSLMAKVVGEASENVLILGVLLEAEYPEQGLEYPASALREKLNQIEDQLLAVSSQIDRNQLFSTILERYSEILRSVVSGVGSEAQQPKWKIEEVEPIQQWLLEGEIAAAAAADRFDQQQSQLLRQRDDVLSDLEKYRRNAGKRLWNATVTVSVPQDSSLELELSYDVASASWQPVHEARLIESSENESSEDEGSAKVTWHQRARVSQSSGESWVGVELTLSTLRSSLGLSAGDLVPVEVSLRDREIPTDGQRTSFDSVDMERSSEEVLMEEGESLGMNGWSSPIIETGFGGVVSFRIKNRVDIPADGTSHTVSIQMLELDAQLDYVAIPALGLGVYRRAKLVQPGPGMLLSGEVQCFRSGTYVGIGEIGNVAPGQSFQQYFGLDGRLKMFVQELSDVQTPSRSAFSSPRYERKNLYSVTSFLDQKAQVEIVDRIPVSMVEELVINVGKDTDPQPKVSRDGICRWNLQIEPGSREEVLFQWIAIADRGSESLLDLVDDD